MAAAVRIQPGRAVRAGECACGECDDINVCESLDSNLLEAVCHYSDLYACTFSFTHRKMLAEDAHIADVSAGTAQISVHFINCFVTQDKAGRGRVCC